MRLHIIVCLFLVSSIAQAHAIPQDHIRHLDPTQLEIPSQPLAVAISALESVEKPKNPKVALFLCMMGGYLGLHRLYLGTSGKTFLLYLVTAGGFGMVWFTDMILLLGEGAIGNFDNYVKNRRFFMFLDKDKSL